MGYLFPFFFALLGIANTAPKGVVPDSVIYSFIVGAGILILCVGYTVSKVREWPPKEYEQYNGSLNVDVEQKRELDYATQTRSFYFLEGWCRAVLQLDSLYVYVDLYAWHRGSQCVGHHRYGE